MNTSAKRVSWARIISNIFSPPVVWAALAFPIAFREADSPEQAFVWGLIYATMVCVIPAIYIGVMVWRGHISDIHMQHRHERIRPFLVSVLCTTAAWWTLRFLGAPPLLPTFTLFSLVAIGSMLVITLVWQISMHTMSVACAVVAGAVLFGLGAGLLLSPLIPLVGAARLKLNRHTPAQVVVGGAFGVGLTLLFAAVNPIPL